MQQRQLPLWRIWAMRALFFITFLGLAPAMWSYMLSPGELIDGEVGVGDAYLTALSTLALLGVRFPQTMLPLLLLQFLYKLLWVGFVGWPLAQAGQIVPMEDDLFMAMAIGVGLDLVIIPWPFVFTRFIRSAFDLKGGGV
ncbi:MAG: hypothetical protein AAFR65_02115 [Pseudomonadota bacterium]